MRKLNAYKYAKQPYSTCKDTHQPLTHTILNNYLSGYLLMKRVIVNSR